MVAGCRSVWYGTVRQWACMVKLVLYAVAGSGSVWNGMVKVWCCLAVVQYGNGMVLAVVEPERHSGLDLMVGRLALLAPSQPPRMLR